MNRIVVLAVALALSASCTKRDAGLRQEPADSGTENRILEEARAEIRSELYSSYDDMSVKELTEKADAAAREAFEPRMAQLVGLGSRQYLALPQSNIDMADYGAVDPQRTERETGLLTELASERWATGRLLSVSWSPVALASLLRTALIARGEEGAEAMAKMSWLNSVAPPRKSRLGDDPQNPVVVFEEPGSCLTVIALALQGDRFVPVKAQRLKKR